MTFEDFPTRIHPFDVYALLNESDLETVDVVVNSGETAKTVDIPVNHGQESYTVKSPIMTVRGREFVETTTVPPITEGGRKLF